MTETIDQLSQPADSEGKKARLIAAIQTVNFSVPGMVCASRPFVIRTAIGDIEGVQSVETDLESRTTVVIFDDEVTTLNDIIFATTVVGYEAFQIEEGTGS